MIVMSNCNIMKCKSFPLKTNCTFLRSIGSESSLMEWISKSTFRELVLPFKSFTEHCGGSSGRLLFCEFECVCALKFFLLSTRVYKVNSWLAYMLLKQSSICEEGGWQWMGCETQHFKWCLTHTTAPGNINESNHLNKAVLQKQSIDSSLWTLACWHCCAASVRQTRLCRISFPVASCN